MVIALAALSGLREAALPDVHHHEVSVGSMAPGTVALLADAPVPDDASHGHQHTCHCVHGHMSGIPAAASTSLDSPGVHESSHDFAVLPATRSLAPPLGPPRA